MPAPRNTPDHEHRRHDPHHLDLLEHPGQGFVAFFDPPVGRLELGILLLHRLCHAKLGLTQLLELGDVAEHDDQRHRHRDAVHGLPQIGRRHRKRSRLAAVVERHHLPAGLSLARDYAQDEIAERFEFAAPHEQLREAVPYRRGRRYAENLAGSRIEHGNGAATLDHHHSVEQVLQHTTVDSCSGFRRHPSCPTVMPRVSSVVPGVRSGAVSAF